MSTLLIVLGVACIVIGVGFLCFETGKEYGYQEARRGYDRMWRIRERAEQRRGVEQ